MNKRLIDCLYDGGEEAIATRKKRRLFPDPDFPVVGEPGGALVSSLRQCETPEPSPSGRSSTGGL